MTVKKIVAENWLTAMALMALSTVATALESGGASFEALDVNKDGRISVSEARKDKTVAGRFASADTNQDGYLDKKEFEAIARN